MKTSKELEAILSLSILVRLACSGSLTVFCSADHWPE